jgi:hypothetical protein
MMGRKRVHMPAISEAFLSLLTLHEEPLLFSGESREVPPFRSVEASGLLYQNVLACFQSSSSISVVSRVKSSDVNYVDVLWSVSIGVGTYITTVHLLVRSTSDRKALNKAILLSRCPGWAVLIDEISSFGFCTRADSGDGVGNTAILGREDQISDKHGRNPSRANDPERQLYRSTDRTYPHDPYTGWSMMMVMVRLLGRVSVHGGYGYISPNPRTHKLYEGQHEKIHRGTTTEFAVNDSMYVPMKSPVSFQ